MAVVFNSIAAIRETGGALIWHNGGGLPQRIVTISVPASVLRITAPDTRVIGPDPSCCTTASVEL